MRLVKILTSERKIFSGAFLDQVTASDPLSRKVFGYINNPSIRYLTDLKLDRKATVKK